MRSARGRGARRRRTDDRTHTTWADGYYNDYAYDGLGRMIEVSENGAGVLATYAYYPLSRRVGLAYGNGTATSYDYEDDGDLTEIAHAFAGGGVTFDYVTNEVAQLTQEIVSNAQFLWRENVDDTLTVILNTATTFDPRASRGGGALRRAQPGGEEPCRPGRALAPVARAHLLASDGEPVRTASPRERIPGFAAPLASAQDPAMAERPERGTTIGRPFGSPAGSSRSSGASPARSASASEAPSRAPSRIRRGLLSSRE
ncbi:MAG: hypothetical protein H6923_09530 [Alphaproteobacteria bacterium]|nr:hypothetical protein [Alphaproteobacteria bacterium]